MTPRRFYHWKSFWLGFLILCSLGWAWRDSFLRPFHATRFQPPRYYQVIHFQGSILLRNGDDKGTRGGVPSWRMTRIPPKSKLLAEVTADWDRKRQSYVAIPHATIFGLSGLCFASVILWRIRRGKRFATERLEIPMESVRTPRDP